MTQLLRLSIYSPTEQQTKNLHGIIRTCTAKPSDPVNEAFIAACDKFSEIYDRLEGVAETIRLKYKEDLTHLRVIEAFSGRIGRTSFNRKQLVEAILTIDKQKLVDRDALANLLEEEEIDITDTEVAMVYVVSDTLALSYLKDIIFRLTQPIETYKKDLLNSLDEFLGSVIRVMSLNNANYATYSLAMRLPDTPILETLRLIIDQDSMREILSYTDERLSVSPVSIDDALDLADKMELLKTSFMEDVGLNEEELDHFEITVENLLKEFLRSSTLEMFFRTDELSGIVLHVIETTCPDA